VPSYSRVSFKVRKIVQRFKGFKWLRSAGGSRGSRGSSSGFKVCRA
jgi:hypothetical protein